MMSDGPFVRRVGMAKPHFEFGRRNFMGRAVLGAAGLLSTSGHLLGGRTCLAAAADPAAGPALLVDPTTGAINPISDRISPSGVAVEIVDFCRPPATSSTRRRALLNYLHHA